MNNISQTLKLIFLSMVGLGLLTYLTVEQPKPIEKKQIILNDMPKIVELIGYENREFVTSSIIKPNSIIFVGNHESIVLANTLGEMLNVKDGEFITISNISDAPWFIKKWQAHKKNVQLKGDKHLPWIYDKSGEMRNFLQIPTSDAVKYFVYKVNSDGIIEKIFTGKVKVGTIDGAMSDEEIKENLKAVVNILLNR